MKNRCRREKKEELVGVRAQASFLPDFTTISHSFCLHSAVAQAEASGGEKAAFSGGVGDMTVTSGDFGLWFPRKQSISSLLYYSVIEALPKLSTK